MGQKVRPTGFRTGIMIPWQSQWYAGKNDFSELLVEDFKIRQYLKKKYRRRTGPFKAEKGSAAPISRVTIERTRERVTVTIFTSRPGVIIGKQGKDIEALTSELENLVHRHIEIKTVEIAIPEIDPQLVAEEIAEQLEKRASFRRTMKQAIQRTMENGAKGIKIQMAGRLGGAEMARTEIGMEGSIPLSSLRTKVEYGFAEASTAQGNIGIKVWVNNGDHLNPEENIDATNAQTRKVSKKPARQGPR